MDWKELSRQLQEVALDHELIGQIVPNRNPKYCIFGESIDKEASLEFDMVTGEWCLRIPLFNGQTKQDIEKIDGLLGKLTEVYDKAVQLIHGGGMR